MVAKHRHRGYLTEPQMKILLLVFMSEIKIDFTLKKSNFLFLLCFEIAIIKFIPNASVITTEKQLLF